MRIPLPIPTEIQINKRIDTMLLTFYVRFLFLNTTNVIL